MGMAAAGRCGGIGGLSCGSSARAKTIQSLLVLRWRNFLRCGVMSLPHNCNRGGYSVYVNAN